MLLVLSFSPYRPTIYYVMKLLKDDQLSHFNVTQISKFGNHHLTQISLQKIHDKVRKVFLKRKRV